MSSPATPEGDAPRLGGSAGDQASARPTFDAATTSGSGSGSATTSGPGSGAGSGTTSGPGSGSGDSARPGSAPATPRSNTAAIVRLLAFLAAGVAIAVLLHGLNVLVVVLAIVAMVMLHELGHFVAAKAGGMKVTEYFLGFGPRLWSIRRGETEYGVKPILAGGYVKIPGMTMMEEVAPEDEARSYRQASFPRRMAVAVAGSTMHMVMAIVLVWSAFTFVGASTPTPPYVVGLLHFAHGKTPAQLAGLQKGDEFVSIGGKKVTSFSILEKEISSHADRPIGAVVERNGHKVHVVLKPANANKVTEYANGQRLPGPTGSKPKGVIGVELSSGAVRKVNPFAAVPKAFVEFGSLSAATWHGIADVFSFHGLSQFAHSVATAGSQPSGGGSATGPSQASGGGSGGGQQTQLLSILGVVQVGSQAASQNVAELLILLAAINVFIGFVNLFPMLPLDGGHVAIAVYERIRSRRGRRYHADVLKLMPVAYVFLAFIVVMGLGALYANIVQPVHLPGG